MMNVHTRSTTVAAFFMIVLSLLGIASVQADGFFYRFAPPLPTVTCGAMPNATSDITRVEWNLPLGASINSYSVLNGTASFEANEAVPSGTGSQNFAGLFFIGPSFPFNAGLRYDTIINGQVVYRSSLIFSCASAGAVGIATITNEVVGIGGSSAINDGRINPENYAPVALYCDGSVLTAYKIDSTGGTLAWSFDLKSDSTDTALIDQEGSALSKTDDGRYSVLAGQSDGKQYLFVFDGCPAPGTTEVYISDPASGQFIRAE